MAINGDFTVAESTDANGVTTLTFIPITGSEPPPPPPPSGGTAYTTAGHPTVHAWQPPTLGSPGIYSAVANKTFFVWQGIQPRPGISILPTGFQAIVMAQSYDHATGTWSPTYAVTEGEGTLQNDTHGGPSIGMDDQGYLHVSYDAHNLSNGNKIRHMVSVNPYDISAWRPHVLLQNLSVTYPKLINHGGQMRRFMRRTNGTIHDLVWQSATPSNGSITWTAAVSSLVQWPGERFYAGVILRQGDEVYIPATRSPDTPVEMRDLYLFRFNMATGVMSNWDGSFTTSTLPVDRVTSDANFRLIDTGVGFGSLPAAVFDDAGQYHILSMVDQTLTHWMAGTASAVGTVAGSNWGTKIAAAQSPGGIQAWYEVNDAGYPRGGDNVAKRLWTPVGGWQAGTIQITAEAGRAIGHPAAVTDGHPDARVMVCEFAPDLSEAFSLQDTYRRHVHGDSGPVLFPA